MAYIDKTGVDNIFKQTKKAVSPISITYSELAALKGSGQLVAGKKYRITDYVTKVNESYANNYFVKSAEHPFDLIVTAIDNTTLSEVANAALHEGDSYFSSCNLGAWQIWYHFDGSSGNYEWSGDTGTIYRMIDEWGNDLPFDFKNIMFGMYHVDEILSNDSDISKALNGTGNPSMEWWFADKFNYQAISITETDGSEQYYGMNTTFWNGGTVYGTNGASTTATAHTGQYCAEFQTESPYITFVTSSSKESIYVYAFSNIYNGTVTDSTVDNHGTMNNIVKRRHDDYGTSDSTTIKLPKIIMSIGGACKDNVVGYNCNNIIIGSLCNSNNIGNNCYDVIMATSCLGNKLLEECHYNYFFSSNYNTLGRGCYGNVYFSESTNNVLGDYCYSNIFKATSCYNNLGANSFLNTFSGATYNEFSSNCNYNKITGTLNKLGIHCQSNTVGGSSNVYGNYCLENTIGGSHNTIGNNCFENSGTGQCNTFDASCMYCQVNGSYNYFGIACKSAHIDGDSNRIGNNCNVISIAENSMYNSIGNGCQNINLQYYCTNNTIDNGVSGIEIKNANSSSNIIQNYYFKKGITSYTSSSLTPNLTYETIVAKKSDGTVVTYNEADLYTATS